jgi:hypothetical protein
VVLVAVILQPKLLFTIVLAKNSTASVSVKFIFTNQLILSSFSIIVQLYAICRFSINSTLFELSSGLYNGAQLSVSLYTTNLFEVNKNQPFVLYLLEI